MNEKVAMLSNVAQFEFEKCPAKEKIQFSLLIGGRELHTCLKVKVGQPGFTLITIFLLCIPVFLTLFSVSHLFLVRRHLNYRILSPVFSSLTELSEKSAIARIATQVVHDIRAPLVAFETVLKISKLEEDEAEIFKAAIIRVRATIDALLKENRRVTEGRMRYLFDPYVSVQELMKIMHPISTTADVRISIRSDNEKEWSTLILGNDELFSRSLQNLIMNAIESYSLEEKRREVLLSIRTEKDKFYISIQDFGKGISPEHLKKLGRVEFSSGKTNGTGLGFIAAGSMASEMGGRISSVKSKVREGTQIEIEFPVAVATSISALKEIPGNKFLLDDDSNFAKTTMAIFGDEKCTWLNKAESVLDVPLETEIPLVLVDYDLGSDHRDGIFISKFLKIKRPRSSICLVTDSLITEEMYKELNSNNISIIPKHCFRRYASLDAFLVKKVRSSDSFTMI